MPRSALQALLLLFLLPLGAASQTFVPKDLDGWQAWVLQDKPYLRCPFFAGTEGASAENRLCALPGRLMLDLTPSGGRFSQSWQTFSDAWIDLPGNLENWPVAVTLDGAPGAVVARGNMPKMYVGAGNHTIAGQLVWASRPESLAVADEIGLISLSLDGQKVEQVDRADGAIWLGKHRNVEVAKQMDVQVYRLLADGIPLQLETRIVLRVTGEAREEILSGVLPAGVEVTALRTPLPAQLESGKLKLQVRAGNFTIELNGRAPESITAISLAAAEGAWPKQEIWSYRSDARLRVAEIDGVPGVDPSQSNVPEEWRSFPSYRVAAGSGFKIVEHSRGALPQEANHLTLFRQLYLNFSHAGYTAVDTISGQMRTGWRLDMQQPFVLAHASSGPSAELVTRGERGTLTGIEVRSPELKLATVARVTKTGGSLPATGWSERFEQVSGALILPPGHRLLAAMGADQAPGAWVEGWSLLDIFLVLMVTVLAFRFSGTKFAALALVGVTLSHQDNGWLVWLLLACLAALILHRQVPGGRPAVFTRWLSYVTLALLLFQLLPFTVEQMRFAFYPQLADTPVSAQNVALDAPPPHVTGLPQAPPAAAAVAAIGGAPEKNVDNPYGIASLARNRFGAAEPEMRYPPGALIQAGPGIPQWQYVRYDYGWSGPVEATQHVRFVILTPLWVGVWRVLGILALALTFYGMTRGDSDLKNLARRLLSGSPLMLPLACLALAMFSPPSRAANTPDRELLEQLQSRLSQPATCIPSCVEVMAARVSVAGSGLEINLDVSALASVTVSLPSLGQHTEFSSITLDGAAVAGVYRDGNQQLWLALKSGVHSVKLTGRVTAADTVALLFPQPPRRLTVVAPGWDLAGTSGGRLLGNTLQLTRHAPAVREGSAVGNEGFSPYVVVRREFNMALDWSIATRVTRLAPEHGGFTLEIPLLPGESVLTGGIDTHGGTRVPASFDSNAAFFEWESALSPTDTLELRAPRDKPWSEVWAFHVSPLWHATFNGTPEVLPESLRPDQWTYEYYPRAGESLKIEFLRPAAISGTTLAIDRMAETVRVGKRTSDVTLAFSYRSTQGGQHSIHLPPGVHVTTVKVDERSVPPRTEGDELPWVLLPGRHDVTVAWQSDAEQRVTTRAPAVDLRVASSNLSTTLDVGSRWVLFAGGRGVGPAILYWGELVFFAVAAVLIGLSRRTPLRAYEWLLLGLGLSTYSWAVLLLAFLWMTAIRWRLQFDVRALKEPTFRALQVMLIGLSLITLLSLLAAIPFGLLGDPDMRIVGPGQHFDGLTWFSDESSGPLPDAWVFSLSLWWYKAAMLAWALWLAMALSRWLPLVWRALNAQAFWHRDAPAVAAVQSSEPSNPSG